MKIEVDKNIYTDLPTPYIFNKNAFIAGVHWKRLNTKKELSSKAKREGADKFVSYDYDELGEKYLVVGLVNEKMLGLPKHIKTMWSLALVLTPLLSKGGYAIIPLDTEGKKLNFVSVANGLLINDIVGGKELIEESLKTFKDFNDEPAGGWLEFAPEDWHIPNSRILNIKTIFENKPPANAKFGDISHKRQMLMLIGCMFVLFCGFAAWNAVLEHRENLRNEANQKKLSAIKRAEELAKRVEPPWESSPDAKVFSNELAAMLESDGYLSLGGWVVTQGLITSDGNLKLEYKQTTGSTIDGFIKRVKEIYGDSVIPRFDLPNNPNIGFIYLPVKFTYEKEKCELRGRGASLTQLISFLQKFDLKYTFIESESNIVNESGVEEKLPWSTFNFNIETSIPPNLLFSNFHQCDAILDSVSFVFNQGVTTYKINGKLYAQN